MRLLHIIPSVSPSRGGPTHAVLQTAKHLRRLGIDAQIATTNDNGPSATLDVPLNRRTDYKGVPVYFFPRFSSPLSKIRFNADKAFLFSPQMTQWLWKSIDNYDVLETRYLFSYASSCARVIAQLKNVPYVVHPTGQLTEWALAQSPRKKKLYSLLLERRNLNRAAAIQCSTAGEVDDVKRFGVKSPTFTVPVGVTPSPQLPQAKSDLRRRYKIAAETSIILFISRLHRKKRPELMIESVRKVIDQGADCHLILAGTGEPAYVSRLKSMINELGISHCVTFAGFVEGTDKDRLFQGSDVFALPSFSENFGVVVVEAMTAALPVVVTPGLHLSHEIREANAGMVVEGDVDSLSNAIRQLIEFPELRQQLGERGRQVAAERYAWDAIAQKLFSVYSSIDKRGYWMEKPPASILNL